jgi:3',5'-cyclic AMP phosphodiesterase CpdA
VNERRVLRVVQLSDTHLSHRRAYGIENVLAVLRWIARDPPDVIVHSGDIVADDPDDPEERAFALGVLAGLPAPLHVLPGNHDAGGFTGDPPTPHRLAAWRDVWGRDTFVTDADGWRLVGANVYRLQEPEHDAWLEAALATDRPTVLFLHQPICLEHPDVPDKGDWSLTVSRRGPVLSAMDGRPVRVVASGHLHRYRAASLPGDIASVWCPAASFLGTPQDDGCTYVVGAVEHLLHADGTASHRLVIPDGVSDLWFEDFAGPGAQGVRDAPLLPFEQTSA